MQLELRGEVAGREYANLNFRLFAYLSTFLHTSIYEDTKCSWCQAKFHENSPVDG
jgi:hypothetical protein